MEFNGSENHLYSTLYCTLTKADISKVFQDRNWESRRCAKDEFEITNGYSELIIEGDGEVLMHGSINNPKLNLKEIIEVLELNRIGYQIEIYKNSFSHELLFEAKKVSFV